MADQSTFGVLALRAQIIDNVRVAYGYLTDGPTVAFDIILAADPEDPPNRRKYHGYVVCGRRNTVMIHTPRKDQIYSVYRSLLEASAELVQYLIDEGKFADPELERRGGLGFFDCWVNRRLEGHEQWADSERERIVSNARMEGREGLSDHEALQDELSARARGSYISERSLGPSERASGGTQAVSDLSEFKDDGSGGQGSIDWDGVRSVNGLSIPRGESDAESRDPDAELMDAQPSVEDGGVDVDAESMDEQPSVEENRGVNMNDWLRNHLRRGSFERR